MSLSDLIFAGDLSGISEMLDRDPALVNVPVALPDNPAEAHPLHRICDAVSMGLVPEDKAVAIAKKLLDSGANIEGGAEGNHDSPLTAACSLRCDDIALLYVERGANLNHPGCHGGTALHWAAWCGRDKVVKRLLEKGADVNRLCTDFKSTPLFWAIHGYRFGGPANRHHQFECAQLLLNNGADRSIPNFEGYRPYQLVEEGEVEFADLLR